VFGFTALFGLGETVLAPTTGPALVTGFIAGGAAAVWIGLPCAGCLGTVAVGARASPRADLGPGLRDRSARDPA
jgi:hypothetical protein